MIPIIRERGTKYQLCRMGTEGYFVFRFDWLGKKPPFTSESVRRELLKRINEIPGIRFEQEVLAKRVRIPFKTLANPEAMEKLKSILSWMIEGIRAANGGSAGQLAP